MYNIVSLAFSGTRAESSTTHATRRAEVPQVEERVEARAVKHVAHHVTKIRRIQLLEVTAQHKQLQT